MANLINSGILPMTFTNEEDYDKIDMYDELKIENAVKSVMECDELIVKNITKGQEYKVNIALSDRQREMMALGGLLNYTRETSNWYGGYKNGKQHQNCNGKIWKTT